MEIINVCKEPFLRENLFKVEYSITGQSPSTTTMVVRDQTVLNPKSKKGSIMG
jgi:hypothetical protein